MMDVEARMEEAEGDEDKMKVGMEPGSWVPYCGEIVCSFC